MAKQKPKDDGKPKGKGGKGGRKRFSIGKKLPGEVNRKQRQAGEVVRSRGRKTNRVVGGKANRDGSIIEGVKVSKKGLGATKGARFYDKNGKRVSKQKALTQKNYLKSGYTMAYRNRGRTGTRQQELVGGGHKG